MDTARLEAIARSSAEVSVKLDSARKEDTGLFNDTITFARDEVLIPGVSKRAELEAVCKGGQTWGGMLSEPFRRASVNVERDLIREGIDEKALGNFGRYVTAVVNIMQNGVTGEDPYHVMLEMDGDGYKIASRNSLTAWNKKFKEDEDRAQIEAYKTAAVAAGLVVELEHPSEGAEAPKVEEGKISPEFAVKLQGLVDNLTQLYQLDEDKATARVEVELGKIQGMLPGLIQSVINRSEAAKKLAAAA